MSQINCPHCGENTDNNQSRCGNCKVRLGWRNWSTLRFVQWTLNILILMSLLVLGSLGASSLYSTALRTTRTEAENNLAAIRMAELAYFEKWGAYAALPYCPARPAGRSSVDFEGPCAEEYRRMGWLPDDPVLCRYWVELVPDHGGDQPDFMAWGECDADGDDALRVYRATRETRVEMRTPNSVR